MGEGYRAQRDELRRQLLRAGHSGDQRVMYKYNGTIGSGTCGVHWSGDATAYVGAWTISDSNAYTDVEYWHEAGYVVPGTTTSLYTAGGLPLVQPDAPSNNITNLPQTNDYAAFWTGYTGGFGTRIVKHRTADASWERMAQPGDAIDAVSSEAPFALVLEDLHWSDSATVELLAMLARRRDPADRHLGGHAGKHCGAAGKHLGDRVQHLAVDIGGMDGIAPYA